MRKAILCMMACLLCLLCLLTAVSVSLAEETGVPGEWYVIELSEDHHDVMAYPTGTGVFQKFSVTPRTTGNSLILEREGVPLFSGDLYCDGQHFFVVLMQQEPDDGQTYVFFMSNIDADGKVTGDSPRSAYFAQAETILFTPAEMFFRGERSEYYVNGGRLFLIDGGSYIRMQMEWLHEDVFIIRQKNVSESLLFVRTRD